MLKQQIYILQYNGTYHSGLRTFDKKFTRNDLLEYDAQNTGGGNFLYIK